MRSPRRASAAGALLMLLSPLAARADFTFIHISDTHVTAADAADSPAAKDAALFREIGALPRRPAFVLSTGDVTEAGLETEFANYRKVKAANLPAEIPVYEAPGNHDSRWNPRGKEGFVKGAKQPLWQSWDKENIHFVLLDSTVLLQHWGHFDREQLDWLAKDLEKTGRDRPVVIGFHHPFGQKGDSDAAQIDNYAALLDVIAPYNVRLFLIGHGHSNVNWSINGIPAIMEQGLYQGSYALIEVTKDKMHILRRTTEHPTPTQEVMTVPLARDKNRPQWSADVKVEVGKGTVSVKRGGLPLNAQVRFALAGRGTQLLPGEGDAFTGTFDTEGLLPGNYRGLVTAEMNDGRKYLLTVPVTLTAADRIAPVWTADLGSSVQSKVVKAGDMLYVPTMGGTLFALDAATGKERWRYATEGALFSVPLVENGVAYFGSADHFVYAVDALTGKLKWKTETGGSVLGGPSRAQGVICIASTDRHIYGLGEAEGEVVWNVEVGSLYQSQAVTDGERFFLGGWDQMFRCIDAKSGKELWSQKFGRSFYYSPAIGSPRVTGDGRVLVTSNDGLMHCMNTADGKVTWETPSLRLGYSGPVFADGKVYNASLSDTGIVYALDGATGNKLWETPTGSVIYDSSVALAGGNLFVGDVNGVFSAVRASDGALQWQYRLGPAHLLCSPAVDNKQVYIGNMEGKVFAFPLAAPTLGVGK